MFSLNLLPFDLSLLVFFVVELEISDARPEEKDREFEDDISLPLIFVGFFLPYNSAIGATWAAGSRPSGQSGRVDEFLLVNEMV